MELENKEEYRTKEEWDKLTAELKKVSLELERSNKDLEHFSYIVSHDLREPLRMILKFTELIIKKFRSAIGNEADEYLGFIAEGIGRMQGIINDLMKYSKLNTTNREFTKVDCHVVLEKVLNNLQPVINDIKAEIKYEKLPVVYGNSNGLIQLFENLIENAIKFRNELTILSISISYEDQDKFFMFSVRDNGIGLDPKFKDKIFLIFQKLHSNKKYPGIGSGLAICKRIVEIHGGEIWVESEPGNGAVFHFTLPKINN